MKWVFKELRELVPRHSADVSSREEKENPGCFPVKPAYYRLNSPIENNFTVCIYIQMQSFMTEHAVSSYLNWLPQW